MGLADIFGGGSKGQNTKVKYELNDQQERVLDKAYPIWNQYLKKNFSTPDTQVAGFGADETAGRQLIQQALASIYGTNRVGADNYAQLSTASDVTRNPYLASAMKAAVAPVFEGLDASNRDLINNFNQTVLPGLRVGAVGSGTYGSPKYGAAVQKGLTDVSNAIGDSTQRASRAALDATSTMGSQAYQAGLDTQLRALGLLPALNQQFMLPGQVQMQIGDRDRAMQQAIYDASRSDYWTNLLLPLQLSQQIVGSVMGVPTGTTTQVGGGGGGLNIGGALQGGMGGAASGAAIGSLLGGPGVGTAIGGGLGVLLGLLG